MRRRFLIPSGFFVLEYKDWPGRATGDWQFIFWFDLERYPVIKRSVAGLAEQTTPFRCELRVGFKTERKEKGKKRYGGKEKKTTTRLLSIPWQSSSSSKKYFLTFELFVLRLNGNQVFEVVLAK